MHFNCKSGRLVNDVFISEVLSIMRGIKIGKLMLIAGKCGLANIMNYNRGYQFGHHTLLCKSTKFQRLEIDDFNRFLNICRLDLRILQTDAFNRFQKLETDT